MRALNPVFYRRDWAPRLFSDLGWADELAQDSFAPASSVAESEDRYEIDVDLPGIKKEDIKIELVDNQLTIAGERKSESTDNRKDIKVHWSKRLFGRFEEKFSLPNKVDQNGIQAVFSNGTLKVVIPKAQESKARTIAIVEN